MEHTFVAELLLRHALGWERSRLLLHWNEPMPREGRVEFQQLIERKAAGEPAQYMIGEQEFYGRPFTVNPAVLIPRPETELLVEEIIRLGSRMGESLHAVDIGTGSGAIAVTLAAACPGWRVTATDLSPQALAVARDNARRNGVDGRIRFAEGDLLSPFLASGETIDILVSNPPYIPTADIEELQPEVRDHEPRSALDGGPDGLDLYRRLVAGAASLPGGVPQLVGLEVGIGQAGAVRDMLEAAGCWDSFRIVPDLAGIERHVLAWNQAGPEDMR